MKKSYKSVLLFFVLLFSLSGLVGCTRDERINAAEFERRLTKYDERCAFFDGEVFYRKPTYYTYYSFACERDVLLTVRHDKYGRVDRVTVTADAQIRRQPISTELLRLSAVRRRMRFCRRTVILRRS